MHPKEPTRKPRQQPPPIPACSNCPMAQPDFLSALASSTLSHKYITKSSNLVYYHQLSHFAQGARMYSTSGVVEFQAEHLRVADYMGAYLKMGEVKEVIKGVIGRGARGRRWEPMHFWGFGYAILRARLDATNNYLRNKNTLQTKLESSSFRAVKFTQNYQDIIKKPVIRNNKKKIQIRDLNASYLELKNLCKNIGTMCKKLQKQVQNKPLQISPVVQTIKSLKQKQFKIKLEHNISAISPSSKNIPKQKSQTKRKAQQQKQSEDIYGLTVTKTKMKKIEQVKSSPKVQSYYSTKRASTEKAQIVYDSPISNAYYAREFNYTEAAGPIMKKKEKKAMDANSKSKKSHSKNSPNVLKTARSTCRKNQMVSPTTKNKVWRK